MCCELMCVGMNVSDGIAVWIMICYLRLDSVYLGFKISYTILGSALVIVRTASVILFAKKYFLKAKTPV